MRGDARFRLQLIGALARDLPLDATLLGVGLPGQDVLRLLAGLRPDLLPVEALSETVLARHPGFAPSLLAARPAFDGPASCAQPPLVVGRQAAEGRVAPAWRVGRFPLAGTGCGLHISALAAVLAQMRRPGLLHLAAQPGHEALLGAVLPVLSARGILVWLDLPPESGSPEALFVLPMTRAFALFGVTPGGGLIRLPQERVPEMRTLLLVPRTEWMAYGLDRLAEGGAQEQEAAFRAPLVVPRSAGLAARFLDRIAPGRDAPQRPVLSERIFLRPGCEIFAEGARLEAAAEPGMGAETGPLLHPMGRPEIRLIALPPAAGIYRLTLVFAGAPVTLPQGLSLRVQGVLVPLAPVSAPERRAAPRVTAPERLPVSPAMTVGAPVLPASAPDRVAAPPVPVPVQARSETPGCPAQDGGAENGPATAAAAQDQACGTSQRAACTAADTAPPCAIVLPEDVVLRAVGTLLVTSPAEPLIFSLTGLPLSGPPIRGIGLTLVEQFGSEIHLSDRAFGQSRKEDTHGSGDDDCSGDGRQADRVAEGRSVWRTVDRRRVAAP